MQPEGGTLDGVGEGRVAIDELDYVNDQDEQVASEVAAASSLSPQKPSAAEIGGSIQDWTEADRQWESLDKVKWVDFVAGDGEAMVGSVLAWKVRPSALAIVIGGLAYMPLAGTPNEFGDLHA